jgi:hypothetical protein
MKSLKECSEKLCSFYVSNAHLVTMLIPYLSRKIKEGNNFIIFTQNNLENEVEMLLSKINIKEEEKQKIRNINWKKSLYQENVIKEKLENNIENLYIIINGDNEYVEKINEKVERINEKNQKNVTIIDCYEVLQVNQEINKILNNHDKILNTSGEKEISEVFQGYQKDNNLNKERKII